MMYMKLDYIKQHSRLDYNDEDALLELYADSAEQTVLNHIGRTYEEVVEEWGQVPDPIRQATLMLVDLSYQQRSPVSQQSMSVVSYGFDTLLKPYMKLSSGDTCACYSHAVIGSQIKIGFSACLPDCLMMKDVEFCVDVYNFSDKDKSVTFKKEECIRICDNDYAVLVDTKTIGIGLVRLKLKMQIPDTDFPDGYRTEIINVNPRISITG